MVRTDLFLPEPSLREVLNDSIVTLLMERDGVDRDQIRGLAARILRHMQQDSLSSDTEDQKHS